MITKPCDNCDRILQFEDHEVGEKFPCPDCGDINIVPEVTDRAAAAGLPPDSGPEESVLKLRPSMWRAHPFLTVFTLGIATFFMWIAHWGERVYVSNKRTVLRRGLLSRSTTEVLHDHVRNIQIEQGFWNRIFNVGTIGISSSGQDGIEILIANIPRPDEVKRIIDNYRPM